MIVANPGTDNLIDTFGEDPNVVARDVLKKTGSYLNAELAYNLQALVNALVTAMQTKHFSGLSRAEGNGYLAEVARTVIMSQFGVPTGFAASVDLPTGE